MLKTSINKTAEQKRVATAATVANLEAIATREEMSGEKIELGGRGNALEFLEKFKPLNCTQKKRATIKGGLSVVCAATGKRVTLSKVLFDKLPPDTDSIQIGYSNDCLLISNYISEDYMSYKLNQLGNYKSVYNSALVQKIVTNYKLDFSNNSSISFPIKEVVNLENGTLILVDMISNNIKKERFNS